MGNKQKSIFVKKYDVLDQVGKGMCSTVYKVKRKEDGKVFAAKISKKGLPLKFADREQILTQIDHPQIIKMVEFIDDRGENVDE